MNIFLRAPVLSQRIIIAYFKLPSANSWFAKDKINF